VSFLILQSLRREELDAAAEARWAAIVEARPELASAAALQRRLIARVADLMQTIEASPLPRLSLPPRYLAAKLARGIPVLAGEPLPLPIGPLGEALVALCGDLAEGGAGDAAEHIRNSIERGELDAGSLLGASLARDQHAIRTGALHRGLAPDLVWLLAELAVGPFAFLLQRALLSRPVEAAAEDEAVSPVAAALDEWPHGHCPACGSWPAMAEVVDGRRGLRCSFCAAAWELPRYACVYCGEEGDRFVTAAPDSERKDRRLELCGACGGYLKTIDTFAFSPFPLLSVADLETMDLDLAAMEHGYRRPPLKEFGGMRQP